LELIYLQYSSFDSLNSTVNNYHSFERLFYLQRSVMYYYLSLSEVLRPVFC